MSRQKTLPSLTMRMRALFLRLGFQNTSVPAEQSAFIKLAALNLAAIGLGFLFCAYSTMLSAKAAETSQTWSDRVSAIVGFAELADKVGTAAADGVNGGDIGATRVEKAAAIALFDLRLSVFAADLNSGVEVHEREKIARALASARQAITKMNAYAELSFRAIEAGRDQQAARYAAAMSSSYGNVTANLFIASHEAQAIQAGYLRGQQDLAVKLFLAMTVVYAMIFALVLTISFRGVKFAEALRTALSDARAAAEAAHAASLAKSQFVATMSHELRTPLNAVIGYAEILEEDLGAEGMTSAAKDATRIRTAARGLLGLINEILSLAKIEAGKMEAKAEIFDLAQLVQDIINAAAPAARRNDNTIHLSIDPTITSVVSDEDKLRQCLASLLSNACKFTEHGTINVDVKRAHSRAGEMLMFIVTDTGIGMSPAQLSGLFRAFTQADGSPTRKFGGTGLGLALTRSMAHLLGGDVTAASKLGEGSTFTLSVPMTLAIPDEHASPAHAA